MFNIYDGRYLITDSPVSYNHLFKLFGSVEMPWMKISELPLGEHIEVDHFIIVRIV